MAGRKPLTTAQAAAIVGIEQTSFHTAMVRLRAKGIDLRIPQDQWPDLRTPMWDAVGLAAWMKTRPGSGNWGKRTSRD